MMVKFRQFCKEVALLRLTSIFWLSVSGLNVITPNSEFN